MRHATWYVIAGEGVVRPSMVRHGMVLLNVTSPILVLTSSPNKSVQRLHAFVRSGLRACAWGPIYEVVVRYRGNFSSVTWGGKMLTIVFSFLHHQAPFAFKDSCD